MWERCEQREIADELQTWESALAAAQAAVAALAAGSSKPKSKPSAGAEDAVERAVEAVARHLRRRRVLSAKTRNTLRSLGLPPSSIAPAEGPVPRVSLFPPHGESPLTGSTWVPAQSLRTVADALSAVLRRPVEFVGADEALGADANRTGPVALRRVMDLAEERIQQCVEEAGEGSRRAIGAAGARASPEDSAGLAGADLAAWERQQEMASTTKVVFVENPYFLDPALAFADARFAPVDGPDRRGCGPRAGGEAGARNAWLPVGGGDGTRVAGRLDDALPRIRAQLPFGTGHPLLDRTDVEAWAPLHVGLWLRVAGRSTDPHSRRRRALLATRLAELDVGGRQVLEWTTEAAWRAVGAAVVDVGELVRNVLALRARATYEGLTRLRERLPRINPYCATRFHPVTGLELEDEDTHVVTATTAATRTSLVPLLSALGDRYADATSRTEWEAFLEDGGVSALDDAAGGADEGRWSGGGDGGEDGGAHVRFEGAPRLPLPTGPLSLDSVIGSAEGSAGSEDSGSTSQRGRVTSVVAREAWRLALAARATAFQAWLGRLADAVVMDAASGWRAGDLVSAVRPRRALLSASEAVFGPGAVAPSAWRVDHAEEDRAVGPVLRIVAEAAHSSGRASSAAHADASDAEPASALFPSVRSATIVARRLFATLGGAGSASGSDSPSSPSSPAQASSSPSSPSPLSGGSDAMLPVGGSPGAPLPRISGQGLVVLGPTLAPVLARWAAVLDAPRLDRAWTRMDTARWLRRQAREAQLARLRMGAGSVMSTNSRASGRVGGSVVGGAGPGSLASGAGSMISGVSGAGGAGAGGAGKPRFPEVAGLKRPVVAIVGGGPSTVEDAVEALAGLCDVADTILLGGLVGAAWTASIRGVPMTATAEAAFPSGGAHPLLPAGPRFAALARALARAVVAAKRRGVRVYAPVDFVTATAPWVPRPPGLEEVDADAKEECDEADAADEADANEDEELADLEARESDLDSDEDQDLGRRREARQTRRQAAREQVRATRLARRARRDERARAPPALVLHPRFLGGLARGPGLGTELVPGGTVTFSLEYGGGLGGAGRVQEERAGSAGDSVQGIAYDVGSDSRRRMAEVLEFAGTVVWLSGTMGAAECEDFAEGTRELVQALGTAAKNGADVLVGGGAASAWVQTLLPSPPSPIPFLRAGAVARALVRGDTMAAVRALARWE